MSKKIFLTAILLVATLAASAQYLPERSLVRKGNRQYNRGKYFESVERYKSALAVDSTLYEALYNQGNACYMIEKYDRAEANLQRAVEAAKRDTLMSDAQRAEDYYNLGNAQFHQQKLQEALQSYRQSLRLNPDDQDAKYNYALTKKLLEQQQQDNQGGGGGDGQDNQDQNQDKNQDQDQDQQNQDNQNQDNQQDKNQSSQPDQKQQDQNGQSRQEAGIPEQQQQQMLDAIQAQEDKTQDKLKEKQGVVIRGKKNW